MAIQIDYFTAPTDAEAAACVSLEDGVRGQFHEFDSGGSSFAVDSPLALTQDVDPGLGLGYLWSVLTHTDLDTYLDQFAPEFIAATHEEDKYVLALDDAITSRLAQLPDESLDMDALVTAWANVTAPEEADAWAPRERDLREFLENLLTLARHATDAGQRVYCWLWP